MSPEAKVGVLALTGLGLFGCWRAFRWLQQGKPIADPWDERTEESIHQPEAIPLCSRCLEPHQPEAQYCPNCGVPVDPLVPYSPYFYMFAFGEMLSGGRPHGVQANWITLLGFLLLPLACLPFLSGFLYLLSLIDFPFLPLSFPFLFVLACWFFFLRNLRRREAPEPGVTGDEATRV